jgi:hypothetical protein
MRKYAQNKQQIISRIGCVYKMKKLLLALICLSLLIAIVGCDSNDPTNTPGNSDRDPTPTVSPTDDPPPPTEAPPPAILPGFEEYRNSRVGFSIQHPIAWFCLDEAIPEDVLRDAISDVFDDGTTDFLDELGVDFNSALVYWFDFDNASDDFVPNVNLNYSDSGGITQNDLKLPEFQTELQEIFEDMYLSVFSGFSVIENTTGKVLGDNYFVTFVFRSEIGGITAGFCQAFTVSGGDLYTFTLTTFNEKLPSAIPVFENMLSTLRFG